ncbi:CoA pyrophosphatase, partial [uncultured Bartonella sp.]|uniref:NUDIX hydrolase n=1 Tax=uncultured Bartonella sp. TaxID=104108 RepID=UPI00261F4315
AGEKQAGEKQAGEKQAGEKQAGEVHLLLTKRTDILDKHKGQIAFPGGKKEKNDQNDEETALREANEEIGLDRRNFSKLGELCCYYTSTGYEVKPIVGIIDKGTQFVRNGQEVAEIFTVPLSFLMERKNYVLATKKLGNEVRSFYAISYENHYIWGATAGMIRALLERLSQ